MAAASTHIEHSAAPLAIQIHSSRLRPCFLLSYLRPETQWLGGEHRLWVRQTWIWILAPSLALCVPLDELFILPKTQFLHEQKDLLRIKLVSKWKGMLYSAWHYYYLASWLVSLLSICLLGCTYQLSASFLRVVASSLSFYQKCLMASHCLEGKDQHAEAFAGLQGSVLLRAFYFLPQTLLTCLTGRILCYLAPGFLGPPSVPCSSWSISLFLSPLCLEDSLLGLHSTQYFLSIRHIVKCREDKMSLLSWMGFPVY